MKPLIILLTILCLSVYPVYAGVELEVDLDVKPLTNEMIDQLEKRTLTQSMVILKPIRTSSTVRDFVNDMRKVLETIKEESSPLISPTWLYEQKIKKLLERMEDLVRGFKIVHVEVEIAIIEITVYTIIQYRKIKDINLLLEYLQELEKSYTVKNSTYTLSPEYKGGIFLDEVSDMIKTEGKFEPVEYKGELKEIDGFEFEIKELGDVDLKDWLRGEK